MIAIVFLCILTCVLSNMPSECEYTKMYADNMLRSPSTNMKIVGVNETYALQGGNIQEDIYVINNGILLFLPSDTYVLDGFVYLFDNGKMITADGSSLIFRQAYLSKYFIWVFDNATFSFRHCGHCIGLGWCR